jgi:hypothetical protein
VPLRANTTWLLECDLGPPLHAQWVVRGDGLELIRQAMMAGWGFKAQGVWLGREQVVDIIRAGGDGVTMLCPYHANEESEEAT